MPGQGASGAQSVYKVHAALAGQPGAKRLPRDTEECPAAKYTNEFPPSHVITATPRHE